VRTLVSNFQHALRPRIVKPTGACFCEWVSCDVTAHHGAVPRVCGRENELMTPAHVRCLWPLTKTVFYVPRVPAVPTSPTQQQRLQQQQPAAAPGGDSQNIAPPPADAAGTLSFPPNVVPVSPGVAFRGGAHEGALQHGAYQGAFQGAEATTPGGRKKAGIISSIFGSRKNR
jgi:hypothetical protein